MEKNILIFGKLYAITKDGSLDPDSTSFLSGGKIRDYADERDFHHASIDAVNELTDLPIEVASDIACMKAACNPTLYFTQACILYWPKNEDKFFAGVAYTMAMEVGELERIKEDSITAKLAMAVLETNFQKMPKLKEFHIEDGKPIAVWESAEEASARIEFENMNESNTTVQ